MGDAGQTSNMHSPSLDVCILSLSKQYNRSMGKRTSLIIEPHLLDEAADVLGTKGTTATVREALERAIRQERLNRLAQLELPEDFMDQLKRMREPRKFDFD